MINIPEGYYSNFIIEEKYGFNKMTKRSYWFKIVINFFLLIIWPFVLGIFLANNIDSSKIHLPVGILKILVVFILIIAIVISLIYQTVIIPLLKNLQKFNLENEKEK